MRKAIAGILLAGASIPAAAQAPDAPARVREAPAQRPNSAPAPISEALVERLIAAYPDRPRHAVRTADPALLERIEAANPGRRDSIREILIEDRRCTAPIYRAGNAALFREIAQVLGPDKVERLIRFYEGPAYRRYRQLVARNGRGIATAPERSELARIVGDYQVSAFYEAFEAVAPRVRRELEASEGLVRCASALRASLEGAGLRAD
ncbi:MAG TPA: hypothetical protein VF702_01735 [Allosphingosinicella sp.]|jgi:hypothetical protein